MSRKMFVNLPVRDLTRSIKFFEKLGFEFNPQFTDETAACMVVSEHNFVMLLTYDKFREFTPNAIADPKAGTQVLVALNCETSAEVDEMVSLAVGAGGSIFSSPVDYGFMYQHSFQDLDGYIWEPFWMDSAAVQ